MVWVSGRSKRRLAKAAGAEPAGQMRDEKLHAVVARSTFASQNVQNLVLGALLENEMSKKCTPLWREAHFQVNRGSDHFWKLRCRKSARRCGAKHISQVKMYKTTHHVRTIFGGSDVVSRGDCAPCQKWPKREGFVAFPRMMAGMGHLKRICKDAFSWQAQYKRHVHERFLGGQGADFLRGVAFWNIRCAGLLRWFCVTGAALRMTWQKHTAATPRNMRVVSVHGGWIDR